MNGKSVDPTFHRATDLGQRQIHGVFVSEEVVADLVRQREATATSFSVTVDHGYTDLTKRHIRPITLSGTESQGEAEETQLLRHLVERQKRVPIQSQGGAYPLR